MTDRRAKNRNSILTGAEPRDRVGGGIQRSAATPLAADASSEDVWSPGDCRDDFHYVKFSDGDFVCACTCLTAWYTEDTDGSKS